MGDSSDTNGQAVHSSTYRNAAGSCMMAAGFALLLIVAANQTARIGFQQGLVFGSEYDRCDTLQCSTMLTLTRPCRLYHETLSHY